MTLPRYRALHEHWQRHPRVEWLVASYLGFKPVRPVHPAAPRTAQPAARQRRSQPAPTGALQQLFRNLGGKPGQTVVLAA